MKIALVGYGKMGRAIEAIAEERGHTVVLRINSANREQLTAENISAADVVIEFTAPEHAAQNVLQCLRAGVPVVCGSTGWNDRLAEAEDASREHNAAFLHASNFSIGVNIFFEINTLLARLMSNRKDYELSIEETHHTLKKDAPSGTAVTLAEQALENLAHKRAWHPGAGENAHSFPVIAHRIEDVPGTHVVRYDSDIDTIELVHTAHNRKGFAMGAVLAAEYIAGRQGVFKMKDVLGIS